MQCESLKIENTHLNTKLESKERQLNIQKNRLQDELDRNNNNNEGSTKFKTYKDVATEFDPNVAAVDLEDMKFIKHNNQNSPMTLSKFRMLHIQDVRRRSSIRDMPDGDEEAFNIEELNLVNNYHFDFKRDYEDQSTQIDRIEFNEDKAMQTDLILVDKEYDKILGFNNLNEIYAIKMDSIF